MGLALIQGQTQRHGDPHFSNLKKVLNYVQEVATTRYPGWR